MCRDERDGERWDSEREGGREEDEMSLGPSSGFWVVGVEVRDPHRGGA